MKALLIPTDENPKPLDLAPDDDGDTLHALQHAVGGYIEPFDVVFGPGITLYVNEEGRLNGMKPNRAIIATKRMEEDGLLDPKTGWLTAIREGDVYDVLNGPIVAVGFDPETGLNRDLTDEQASEVADYFTRVSRPGSGELAS